MITDQRDDNCFDLKRLRDLLRTAALPTPWLFRNSPQILTENGALNWIDYTGYRVGLIDYNQIPRLLAKYYIYAVTLPLWRLLLWAERAFTEKGDLDESIEILLLDTNLLQPLNNIDGNFAQIDNENSNFCFEGGLITSWEIPNSLPLGCSRFEFPLQVHSLPEILVLADNSSDEMLRNAKPSKRCIYCLRPSSQAIEVIPQDWFNNGNFDLGYQWIARIVRDPISGLIVGGGFRIPNFVLDNTGRNRILEFE